MMSVLQLTLSRGNLLFKRSLILNRFYSSALYITGEKATTHFAVLVPYLDFEERLSNRSELEKNLKSRGIGLQVKQLEDLYSSYKSVENELHTVEKSRSEIAKLLNHLLREPDQNKDVIIKLKTTSHIAKKEYKIVKDNFHSIEEVAALKILGLPNILHKNTPIENDVVFYEFLEKTTLKIDSHLEVASSSNLIEYVDPTFVVLQNDASLFELAVTNYFQNILLDYSFTQYSNCDFVRSVVVEGCGNLFSSNNDVFTIEHQVDGKTSDLARDHLVGGASLQSFMAYFTKHFVQIGYIPLRLFTNGRLYAPVSNDEKSLFSVVQSTGIHLFIATEDNEQSLESELESLLKVIKNLYDSLGYHYRLSYIKSGNLHNSESLRISIEMWSPNSSEYIEVGNVSSYENYLSKRLLFTYNDNNKDRKFLRVLSGTVLNVQKLLGCVIENNAVSKKDLISNILKKNIPL